MSRVLVTVLVLAASLTVSAFPAGAQSQAEAQPAAPQKLQELGAFADFNNDGHTDLAVGTPGEDFGATADAGAITVFLGTGSGTGLPSASQTLVQDNPETGDQFGAALAVGDFNDDDFDDLAVGAPGEDVGATADAGAANRFANAGGGLPSGGSQTLPQDNPEAGDRFGAAFAIERFDIGSLDLVVGAPGENVGAVVDAGAANLFSNTTGVLPSVSSQTLLQAVETGDQFGTALDG
jgi:hypothetical protein